MTLSVMYTMYFLDIPLIWACHLLCMVLIDHTIVTFIYSLLVHQVLDRVLSDPALVYNILITRLWYNLSVYKTQREVPFLPVFFTLFIEKFYGLGCYFTTVFTIFKILHIVMIGGGGYVVKTYPSIDPIAAPPGLINIYMSLLYSRA